MLNIEKKATRTQMTSVEQVAVYIFGLNFLLVYPVFPNARSRILGLLFFFHRGGFIHNKQTNLNLGIK